MQALYHTAVYPADLDVGWSSGQPAVSSGVFRVIVVTQPLSDPEEPATLSRMLSAIGAADEEVHIHHLEPTESMSWAKLRGTSQPIAVLLFGIEPAQLAIRALLPHGIPSHFDGCTWVIAPPVNALIGSAEAKRKLWAEGLQPLKAILTSA